MALISREEVRHVAHLARVELSEEEVALFQTQLAEILSYIRKLDELDTEQVEPMKRVMGLQDVFREDELQPSLTCEEALANAPDRGRDSFRVPCVVD